MNNCDSSEEALCLMDIDNSLWYIDGKHEYEEDIHILVNNPTLEHGYVMVIVLDLDYEYISSGFYNFIEDEHDHLIHCVVKGEDMILDDSDYTHYVYNTYTFNRNPVQANSKLFKKY